MVNDLVTQRLKELLGSQKRKILVTGATGFVGRRLAETLHRAGHEVTATGRNRYLAPPEIPFLPADIRDRKQTIAACKGQQIVIHCASKTSPWGNYDQFATTNVEGTKNIVAGCLNGKVARLVHVSSTSIHFRFRDQFDINENAELPKRFACHYAKSKHIGECVIRDACQSGLNAIIIRARAVFGPGDQSLLPRLLQVYDQGRLRQIGNGKNVTDLTYIDNLIYAIALAFDNGPAGSTCTITGGEPLALWELIRRVLEATGRNSKLKPIPYSIAYWLAACSEAVHHILRRKNEPALTRYTVGLLSKSQTFSKRAAEKHLNYRPLIRMEDGIRLTIDSLKKRSIPLATSEVKIRYFTTGCTRKSLHLAEQGADRKPVAFHAMFAVIEHPHHGITLFDTGYAPRVNRAATGWPYGIYSLLTPIETSDELSCIRWLQRNHISPADVKRIVLSHFHADHIGGLRDFPNADIIATATAWENIVGKSGIAALNRAFLPQLLPDDIRKRLFLLHDFSGPGIGPFSHTFDLFSDGSVRLISLPGHARGQIGALLQTAEGQATFLVADAVWTNRTIAENLRPTYAFRMIADSSRDAWETIQKLQAFHERFPAVDLVPTHCRSLAERYNFDEQVAKLMEG